MYRLPPGTNTHDSPEQSLPTPALGGVRLMLVRSNIQSKTGHRWADVPDLRRTSHPSTVIRVQGQDLRECAARVTAKRNYIVVFRGPQRRSIRSNICRWVPLPPHGAEATHPGVVRLRQWGRHTRCHIHARNPWLAANTLHMCDSTSTIRMPTSLHKRSGMCTIRRKH